MTYLLFFIIYILSFALIGLSPIYARYEPSGNQTRLFGITFFPLLIIIIIYSIFVQNEFGKDFKSFKDILNFIKSIWSNN